jgi:transposase
MTVQKPKTSMKGVHPGRYSPEFKADAVAMLQTCRNDFPSETAAIRHVCNLLGISSVETLRKWSRQTDIDTGKRTGMTSDDLAELRRLKREVAELKRTNGILKAASAFFAAEIDRPQNR